MPETSKPRLVFFRWPTEGLPDYIRLHLQQHVECLSRFFEVTVISQDCDYQQVCETHQPDLALFESGVYAGNRLIRNTSSHPNVPKIGLCNADAYCVTRSTFISDMDRWGVDTFFSISVSLGEYTPAIASNLFTWPNFVDGDLYRDYGGAKVIPVLFTGSQAAHYPWRNQVCQIVSQYYPSLIAPHFGWFDSGETGRMIYGENYARMLNASWMAPTCGTIAKELVRKHFEIPASKACLITEQTASVEAAGFVDMQNCVFADRSTVLDKINHLFQHPEELARITEAGFRLVHARHTAANRDQLRQWFDLRQGLGPNQRIVQTGPFDPLVVVDSASGVTNSHVISDGVDRLLLREGDRKLTEGRLDEAEGCYFRCLNYHFIPEPVLGLTRCSLRKGDATRALHWIAKPISATMQKHQAADPDPVEWAWFTISLLCQGNLSEATRRARQFPLLHHVELARTRAVMEILNGGSHRAASELERRADGRHSVHQPPDRSFADWAKELCGMLDACGQDRLSDTLIRALSRPDGPDKPPVPRLATKAQRAAVGKVTSHVFPLFVEPVHARLRRQLRAAVKSVLHRLSARRNVAPGPDGEEVCRQIQRIAREEQITTAVLIGAPRGARSTEAFLEGLQENPARPSVFCIGPATSPARSVAKLKEEKGVDHFGIVYLDGGEADPDDIEAIIGADILLFTGVNRYHGHMAYIRLLGDPTYQLVTHDPLQHDGFAIFRKQLYPTRSLSRNRDEA